MIKEALQTFKKVVKSYAIAYFAKATMWAVMRTCRLKVNGLENLVNTATSGKCILMLWHNRLSVMPEMLKRHASQFTYMALVSNSRDGEPLAILVNSYTFGRTLRVAHDLRFKALQNAIQHLKYSNEIIVITPDGPRGPRYQMKPGIATAARKTGAGVVPVTWSASRFWQLNTWDKFMLPKPFSTIHVDIGPPVCIPDDPDKEVSQDTALLESALNALCQENNKKT